MFILGFAKSRVTYANWFKSGIETLLLGTIAAVASWAIGLAFEPLISENA